MTATIVIKTVAHAAHLGGALLEQLLNDLEIICRVVVEVLRRDDQKNLVDCFDGVFHVGAVLVGALEPPFQVLVEEVTDLGELLRMLFDIVCKLFELDFYKRRIKATRVDIVDFSFVLRVEAAACAA